MRDKYNTGVGKPERKIPPGRPKRSRKHNIKLDLTERGCDLNTSIC
jgi:hypothetical protein